MVPAFEAEANEDEAGDHERRGNVHYPEPGFGFEMTIVAFYGHVDYKVVDPVASEEAKQYRYDRGEVEESFRKG